MKESGNKRTLGKPYCVYMMGGGARFQRIHFGRVRDCLKSKGLWDPPALESGSPG